MMALLDWLYDERVKIVALAIGCFSSGVVYGRLVR